MSLLLTLDKLVLRFDRTTHYRLQDPGQRCAVRIWFPANVCFDFQNMTIIVLIKTVSYFSTFHNCVCACVHARTRVSILSNPLGIERLLLQKSCATVLCLWERPSHYIKFFWGLNLKLSFQNKKSFLQNKTSGLTSLGHSDNLQSSYPTHYREKHPRKQQQITSVNIPQRLTL